MKIAKNMVLAICLGVVAGFFAVVCSYYFSHREGGVKNIFLAVADSAERIRDAYADTTAQAYDSLFDRNLLAGGRVSSTTREYIDERIPALSDSVLAAFNDIAGDLESGNESEGARALENFGSVFGKKSSDSDVISVNQDVDVENPYADILRFHVRANSDSKEDQELKLAVKDDVVAMLKPLLSDCGSVAASKEIIVSNLQNIYMTVVNTITEQGYDYPVKVYVTAEEFPAKTYGDLTFPEGNYQALRIDIGNALGQNWWCVMYPPLCFIDDATVVVSDEGKEILKESLSDAEYRALLNDPDTEIRGESIIYNKLKELIEKIG